MMLFSINSILQAFKKAIWTLYISIYRQGFGVAFFVWVFISIFNFDVQGVWLGIATAVSSGWILSFVIANKVAQKEIDKLEDSQHIEDQIEKLNQMLHDF